MGRQIIKQPNGRFAVWSSVVDNFIFINATSKDIVDMYAKEELDRIELEVTSRTKALDEGQKPYGQFTKSWEEALEDIKEQHGEKELNKLMRFIDGKS